MNENSAPILVFGYGNPSRGDDALGPRLIERLERHKANGILSNLDLLVDFQLQAEHALDLQDRERVIFVDAGLLQEKPFRCMPVYPERDASYTTHAMSPNAVLHILAHGIGAQPPPCMLLVVGGYEFDLGSPLSMRARENLALAEAFLLRELGN